MPSDATIASHDLKPPASPNRYAVSKSLPDYLASELRVKREADLADAIAAAETGNRQPLYDLADRIDAATEHKVKAHLRAHKGVGDYCLSFDAVTGVPDGIIKRATGDVYRVGTVVPVSCLHGEGPAEPVCFCAYADFIYRVNGGLMRAGFERRVCCKHLHIWDSLCRRWERERGKGPVPSPIAFSWMQAFPVADGGDRFGDVRHRGCTLQGDSL
jgi:hypothetical protein